MLLHKIALACQAPLPYPSSHSIKPPLPLARRAPPVDFRVGAPARQNQKFSMKIPVFQALAVCLALLFCSHLSFGQAAEVPVKINVPYVQYLKLKLDPADLGNNSELVIQNTDKKIDLKYKEGTPVTLSQLDFRGDFNLTVSVAESGSNATPASALPLKFTVRKETVVQVKLTPKAKGKNLPPVADAGLDQVIHLPATSTVLDGWHSVGNSGNITSYKWAQTAGPSTAGGALQEAKDLGLEVKA